MPLKRRTYNKNNRNILSEHSQFLVLLKVDKLQDLHPNAYSEHVLYLYTYIRRITIIVGL